jgi:hypothetical protein
MSESKFSGIFDKAKAAPTDEAQPEPPERKLKLPPAARPLGRPPGKRSDPEWKQFSVLLKRDTQREAVNLLRAKNGGLDLSGLIQSLLEGWIKKQS